MLLAAPEAFGLVVGSTVGEGLQGLRGSRLFSLVRGFLGVFSPAGVKLWRVGVISAAIEEFGACGIGGFEEGRPAELLFCVFQSFGWVWGVVWHLDDLLGSLGGLEGSRKYKARIFHACLGFGPTKHMAILTSMTEPPGCGPADGRESCQSS